MPLNTDRLIKMNTELTLMGITERLGDRDLYIVSLSLSAYNVTEHKPFSLDSLKTETGFHFLR